MQKEDGVDGSEVLNNVLHLVARLEQDRQETTNLYQEEKAKAEKLSVQYSLEREKRLDLLLKLVQEGKSTSF